ncbi:hypothetical protein, partial [Bradyrhizobium canariense]|uniref:hypothetical protein n=1 Tax=Bradyrhizobium canariense TaxID=255045 RepID=UPI001AEC924D
SSSSLPLWLTMRSLDLNLLYSYYILNRPSTKILFEKWRLRSVRRRQIASISMASGLLAPAPGPQSGVSN